MAGPEVMRICSVHLAGDDAGEGGLAEAGRAVEEDVVQRLAALARGGDGDAQVLLDLVLADVLVQAPGAQGGLGVVFVVLGRAGENSISGHSGYPIL